MKTTLSVIIASIALAGCATSNPDVISRHQAGQLAILQSATVESVRTVTIDGKQSGIGAVAGAIVGGIAGSSVGGKRDGQIVGVLAGVAGAAAGNAIERSATSEQALEITLRMHDGSRRVLVQARGAQDLYPGDRVNLIQSGNTTRAVLAR